MELGIYVPYEGTITTIKPGAAICGTPDTEERPGGPGNGTIVTTRLMLYYEGNIYGSTAFPDWETMLFHAADRLIARYPTVARCWVESEGWLHVGWYDHDLRRLDIEDQAALDAWKAVGKHAPHPTKSDLVELWEETR